MWRLPHAPKTLERLGSGLPFSGEAKRRARGYRSPHLSFCLSTSK